jgi:nucleotide-binding universal stress UspA family protein
LTAASEIASVCGSELYLALVIPTSSTLPAKNASIGMLLPVTIKEILNILNKDAEKYISGKLAHFREKGIKAAGEVSRGDPVKMIEKIAKKNKVDLIVMGTHGKAGLNAFWSGSFAAKITNKINSSILFIPARK